MADNDAAQNTSSEDHPDGNGPTNIPEETLSESELSLDKQAERMHEKNDDK